MEIKNIFSLKVTDSSFISEARRLAAYAAEAIGFSEADRGKISIIATELVSNIIKHTNQHSGGFFVRELKSDNCSGIEILSIDNGPGMINVAECLRDGYSTAGSVGTGLGSIQRLSDDFDIYSVRDLGTVILSRVWLKNKLKKDKSPWDFSVFSLPKPGETLNGDAWKVFNTPNKMLVMLTDGLGHGLQAAEASEEAKKEFEISKELPLNEIINNLHLRLKHTRGAAISLAEIDSISNTVKYCGIGNVSGVILYPESTKYMISHNGIVGHELRKVQVYEYPWKEEAKLIMHSDGVSTRWNMEKYIGLFFRTLPVIISTLYRDNHRDTDDATILAGGRLQRD